LAEVVGESGAVVEPGVAGELQVRGPNVMKGVSVPRHQPVLE
jgi:long-subunit acyl-CoA synthetase (AMP-forming)